MRGGANLGRAGLIFGPGLVFGSGLVFRPGLGRGAHLLLAGVGLLGLRRPGGGLGWLDLAALLSVVNLVVAGANLLLLSVVDLVAAAGV